MNSVSTNIKHEWVSEVTSSYEEDDTVQQKLIQSLMHPTTEPDISVIDGLLRYKWRIYIGR